MPCGWPSLQVNEGPIHKGPFPIMLSASSPITTWPIGSSGPCNQIRHLGGLLGVSILIPCHTVHLISGCSEVFPVRSQKRTRFGAACLMLSKHSVRAMVHTGTWLKTGWLPSASPCKAKFQISITFFDLFSMQPVKFTRLKAGSSRYMFLLSVETSDNNHNYP